MVLGDLESLIYTEAAAIILHSHDNLVVLNIQGDLGLVGLSVSPDVIQQSLHCPENDHLRMGLKTVFRTKNIQTGL